MPGLIKRVDDASKLTPPPKAVAENAGQGRSPAVVPGPGARSAFSGQWSYELFHRQLFVYPERVANSADRGHVLGSAWSYRAG